MSDLSHSPDHFFAIACDNIQSENFPKAIEILERLVSENNDRADFISKLGTAYAIIGQRQEAIKNFSKAISVDPDFVIAHANLSLALAEEGNYREALSAVEKGLSIDPNHLPLYSTQALILKYLDRVDEAIEGLRQADKIKLDDVQILSNLASLLAESGQAEGARTLLERVVTLAPSYMTAHRMLAVSTKYTSGHPHIEQMEEIAAQQQHAPEGLIELHFALGKAYEDTKDFKKSFAHYKNANDALRKTYGYDLEQDRTTFENIKNTFTSDYIKSHQIKPSDVQPIFILGMPRSGTSLVEQILASHPDVYAAGELNTIELLQGERSSYEGLTDKYLTVLRDRRGGERVFTDKMPLNFRYIGFIKCLFPHAKIIHCRRDPIDTCLSIYKTKFAGHLPFAQNLEEVGAYYKLYEDLMAHWHKVLPDTIYDLSYEALVEAPEAQIRQMLGYCDLPWEDKCLTFHENKRAVTTASTLQVRKPIYKDALQYWKNYEPYLSDLVEKFE